MKENPIVIGFDDATFNLKSGSETTMLIGVVCQGVRAVNLIKTDIKIDGSDGTDKIIELVRQNEKHVQFIFTHTITFGGFNIVDLEKIYGELNKPVIAINEKKVDLDSVIIALEKTFPNNSKEKVQNIFHAGNLYQININTAGGFSTVYFHKKGIEVKEVELLLQKVCIDSKLPECLRIAHLIGSLF
ncbi:MAG: endonuclease dU [Promethearchaeota archaeon]|jgi:endonuclease V-like protein UPF0215 family